MKMILQLVYHLILFQMDCFYHKEEMLVLFHPYHADIFSDSPYHQVYKRQVPFLMFHFHIEVQVFSYLPHLMQRNLHAPSHNVDVFKET